MKVFKNRQNWTKFFLLFVIKFFLKLKIEKCIKSVYTL